MKKVLSLVLTLVLVLSLVACEGGNEGSGDKVTLKIGLPSGEDITPMEIVESFKEANPDIEVIVDESPWTEFKNKLKIQIASNNAPDVFITDSGYAATLGAMGAVVDLSGKIEEDLNPDDFSATLYAGKDGEGNVWGVPHGLNAIGIYYNKKLFDEAGLAYPTEDWTFDDLFDMARKLTKDKDGDGEIDQYGFTYGSNVTEGWLPFVTANGGAPLDETRSKSMFSDAKTVEGLKKYAIPQQEGFAPTLEWCAAQGSGVNAFYLGKVAMMLTMSSHVNAINSNAPDGFEYDVQMMPIGWDGNRHCVYVPNMWCIAAKSGSAQQEAAWKWIKHFLSESSQQKVAENLLSGYPIRKSALEFLETQESVPANMQAFYTGLDTSGVTLYENGSYEEWRPKVDEQAAKIRKGDISVDDAAKTMDNIVKEVLGE